jgi:enamine deaminase RidA (YjgF/YER057c/UK114 family)
MRFTPMLAVTSIFAATAMLSAQSTKQVINVGPSLGLPFSSAVKAGGLVYVSGSVAAEEHGRTTGDIRAQTKQTLDGLARTLEASGSSMPMVASVMVYLRNAADFAAMNEVYKGYWPKDPPARTTVVAPLALRDALVEISMIAVPNGGERRVVHPTDWLRSPNPYSYGIQTGNTLFLSGLVSRNGHDNSVVKGDMTAQTKTVLDNGAAILKAAGMSYGDVVSARVFITDSSKFPEMNAAYRPYFPAAPPARATVNAGLTSPDYVVEITMTAVKDPSRTAITTPNADGTPGTANPNLSAAIRVGNRLFLSGMLGNDASNAGKVGPQTTEALARLGRTLKAASFDWPNVVESMVYLPDISKFSEMNDAYRGVLMKDFPARTTIQAGLMGPGAAVEIMMTAVK